MLKKEESTYLEKDTYRVWLDDRQYDGLLTTPKTEGKRTDFYTELCDSMHDCQCV